MTDPPSQDTPPVKTPKQRHLGRIAGGLLLAGTLLVALLIIDTGPRTDERRKFDEAIELIPGPLAQDEITAATSDPGAGSSMPVLAAGGWIQTVDSETGRLSQQYRFDRLDPNPPGEGRNWVLMDQPRAEIYLSADRVITLTGDSALVHLPHRVLESGTMTGSVTIKVFKPGGEGVSP